MSLEHQEHRVKSEIIEICKRLNSKNMLAAADGNISFRLSDHRILITPSGVNKAFLQPGEMACVDIDGKALAGKPSSETKMHLEIYQSCPAAKCVVHAHPPTAIAWSVAYPEISELPSKALSEVILAVGKIPVVPYARPGTKEMGTTLREYLPSNRVFILARHGALSWGESLMEAYNGMERLEHSAHVLMTAAILGGITELPESEVMHLRQKRKNLGERSL